MVGRRVCDCVLLRPVGDCKQKRDSWAAMGDGGVGLREPQSFMRGNNGGRAACVE